MKNIFFFKHINSIGGVESFLYYIAKKYQNRDITVYYVTGDTKQIQRLREIVRTKKYRGEKIKCEKAFFNYNLDIINNVEANEYIQIIHADYKAMGIKANLHPKITKYYGVSKQVCDSFKEVSGCDIELCYNPIILDKPKRVLNLISATRLTKEKGKLRMVKLAEALDKANIPYIWTIFTNDLNAIDNPNVVYMKPKLDITSYIANADYLVQLSDNEGYCYSVIESLLLGIPVIITKCPVFDELGCDDNNSIKLDFDMENIPIDTIYNKIFNFKYIMKEDNWDNILASGENTYLKEKEKHCVVRCIRPRGYDDMKLGRFVKYGESITVDYDRAIYLEENNVVKIL